MPIKWQGSDPETLIARIQAYVPEEVVPELVRAMEVTVQHGAERQKKALDEATTAYGEARFGAGQGGSAGRNDTGDMIDNIDSAVETEGNVVRGSWGWDDPDGKTIAQEFGIGNPPPAHSLPTSFYPTREELKGRINKIAKGN